MTTICKKNYERRTEEEELLVITNSAVEDQDPEDRLQLHMKKIIKKTKVMTKTVTKLTNPIYDLQSRTDEVEVQVTIKEEFTCYV